MPKSLSSFLFSLSRYFFPTYEDDNLLCQLEDEDDAAGYHGNEVVIAEDAPVLQTILSEEKLRKEILTSWWNLAVFKFIQYLLMEK